MILSFDKIIESLSKIFKNPLKTDPLSKDKIIDSLNECIALHNNFLDSTKSLSDKEINKFKIELNDSNKIELLDLYYKGLNSNSKSKENKRFLSSLEYTNTMFINIANKLIDNIDSYINEENINYDQLKITHIAILNFITISEIVSTWSTYFWTNLIKNFTDIDKFVPNAIKNKLKKNANLVIETTNDISNKDGLYNLLYDLENIKKRNHDFSLSEIRTNSLIPKNIFNKSLVKSNLMYSGLGSINPFFWLGIKWDRYKHDKFIKNKQTKTWLEKHVTLLKMQLDEIDPDNSEYLDKVKIIENYDNIIYDLDRKINEYLQEG